MKNHQIQREPRKENNECSLRKRNLEEVKLRKKKGKMRCFSLTVSVGRIRDIENARLGGKFNQINGNKQKIYVSAMSHGLLQTC